MAGLVFPNDAGKINYALRMGHNYTSTDPFHWPCSGTLCPCLGFQIIHQHFCIFSSFMCLIYLYICVVMLGKYSELLHSAEWFLVLSHHPRNHFGFNRTSLEWQGHDCSHFLFLIKWSLGTFKGLIIEMHILFVVCFDLRATLETMLLTL